MNSKYVFGLVAFSFLFSSLSIAQDDGDFSLFESVESANTAEITRPRDRRGRSEQAETTPEFTLKGTSRIGSRYQVMLEHRSGKKLLIPINNDMSNNISGYREFSIVSVKSGEVRIQIPADSDCIEASNLGVSCNENSNIAILTLANGEPISSSQAATIEIDEIGGEEVETAPLNPFAAMREASAENATTGGRGRRFTPRRISDEDIPPGMRVVSTPFGDRLVEQ